VISQGRPAIALDGVAGAQTIAALTAAGPGLPVPFLEPTGRTSRFVGISKTLADRLAALRLPASLRPPGAPTVSAGGAILEEPTPSQPLPSVPNTPPPPAVSQSTGISPLVPVAAIALGFAAYYLFGKGSA